MGSTEILKQENWECQGILMASQRPNVFPMVPTFRFCAL